MTSTPRLKRMLVAATAVTLAAAGPLAGCGSDDESAEGTDTTSADSGVESAVTVEEVWARPGTAGGNSAVYMDITGGDTDDALVGVSVSTEVVETAEVHETTSEGGDMGDMSAEGDMGEDDMGDMDGGDDAGSSGMMSMQQVESIVIPAGETVALEPGGYHVMMLNLAEDLVAGDTVDVTLDFDSGTTETVTAEVREP